jgi:predicted Zn-ribbon and HTH transcriptional regulator
MEHKAWRKTFSFEKQKNNALLKTSWYCKVCKWAYDNKKVKKMGKMARCPDKKDKE